MGQGCSPRPHGAAGSALRSTRVHQNPPSGTSTPQRRELCPSPFRRKPHFRATLGQKGGFWKGKKKPFRGVPAPWLPGCIGKMREMLRVSPFPHRAAPPVPAMHPSGLEGRKPDCCLRLCFEHVSGFRSMFNKGNLTSTRRPESLWGCGASTIGVLGAQWGQALLHHPGTTPQSAQLLQMSLQMSSAPPRPQFPDLLQAL